MVTTTNAFDPEFFREMIVRIQIAADDGVKLGAHLLWDGIIMPILKGYWWLIVATLFVVFLFVTIKAFLGRWGSLGSFLYTTMYFGTILIVGLILGSEFLVSDFFHIACAIILYPVCYLTTGLILNGLGVRRPRRF